MKISTLAAALCIALAVGACASGQGSLTTPVQTEAPVNAAPIQHATTIVLVHGAFADGSSWNGVIAELRSDGYRVIAAANPLRSVAGDAAGVGALVGSIDGPVLLVGHSYGGAVITQAAEGHANVQGLVYVAGFAPDVGETSFELSSRFPGGTLGETLAPVPINGGQDLYINPDRFRAQFAADVPQDEAALMAATQRPVTLAALQEPERYAAWRSLPSFMIWGSADLNIPPRALRFMAERAHARRMRVIDGASHVLMVSHSREVATFIEAAARDSAPQ